MDAPVETRVRKGKARLSGHLTGSTGQPHEISWRAGGCSFVVQVRPSDAADQQEAVRLGDEGYYHEFLLFLGQAIAPNPAANTWQALVAALRKVQDPAQDALAARLFQGCSVLLDRLGETDRPGVLAASNGLETLLRALEAPTVQEALHEHDPFAPARARWLQDQQRILQAEGGALSTEELSRALGITKEGVRQRSNRGSLLALPVGHALYFPVWQFTDTQQYMPLPGLRDVLSALAGQDAWGKAIFMLGGEPSLGGARPIDLLRRGETEPVVAAARHYGEQGAR